MVALGSGIEGTVSGLLEAKIGKGISWLETPYKQPSQTLFYIEQVLDRGEKIELLVDKTDYLQHESFTFKREARRLKSKMYWRNVRMTLLIVFAVLLVIYIIICFTCGPTFRCVRS